MRIRSITGLAEFSFNLFDARCCHMGAAIKHPVPDRVKPSFVIFDIRALWRSGWASECPDVKNYKWRLNPVWHGMLLYLCGNSGRQRVQHHLVLLKISTTSSPSYTHWADWREIYSVRSQYVAYASCNNWARFPRESIIDVWCLWKSVLYQLILLLYGLYCIGVS